VGEVTVRQMLGFVGLPAGSVLDPDDLELLLEYYPNLRPLPLPAIGYTSATDLITIIDRADVRTTLQLRQFARQHGITFGRYVAPGGQPDFYVTDDEAGQLLAHLDTPAM
jgi:hypothetical protein